ncbi:MAG: hypothetical protein PHE17_18120 [Thiothrix sp.]|uniref:hypothetical protein n=1 Tax=Thiothrix sp. TaxID=1032 RepID=UPI0026357867|nr:hypothetical protein [Thiothrix sp.]MDD5394938.1 hypothetical protein [Thiothrix sp.]
MTLLQYHTAATLTPLRETCIDQVRSKVPPEVEYEFHDEFPIDPLSIDDTIDRGDKEFGKRQSYSMIQAADLVSLKLATERPQMLKVDTDTVIDKWYDFPLKGKPYFGTTRGYPDLSIFYVNDCPEFFKELLARYLGNEDRVRTMKKIEWAQGFLRGMIDKIYLIPPGYFRHLCLGHIESGAMESIYCQDYGVKKDENGVPRFMYLHGIMN